jgi:hypothetical protein
MSAPTWARWFAWHPVKTRGGHWAWLRRVDRAWDWDLNPWGYDGHSGTDGGWAYRMPLRPNVL